jgi:RND superfamily putative drug exporter
MWDRVTGAVTAHPVISVVTTAGFLIVLSSAVLSINLGSTGLSALPDDSPSLHAFEVIDADFSDGLITSMIVIDSPNVESYEIQSGIESLLALLEVDESYGDLSVTTAPNGDLVVIDAVIKGDFSSNASRESTLQLRNEYIPATFDGTNAEVYVAGGAADVIDNVNLIKTWLPAVFGLVLVSSFLLLLVVFRSIVVPIKAVAMNALSVGAAYGLLVIVFQKGIGADLLGFQQTDTIEFWLPLFLFSILFGLSMDYHVFLLSRIKEHYDATGDNSGSVAFGLRNTAGIITGAALIMVAVFGGFAIGDLAMFQQMGFGLAAAVIIDATLIRSILVPASMELLGDWNWYFPSWLEWLPSIEMEGTSQAPAPVTPAAVPAPAISVGPATGAAD